MHLRHKHIGRWLPMALISIGMGFGVLYQMPTNAEVGTNNRASAPEANTVAPAVSELITGLEARLVQNSDDFSGWVLLAQSYLHMDAPVTAQRAIERAKLLAHGNADRLVRLAAAIEGFEIAGSTSPDKLLHEALNIQPDHQQAAQLVAQRLVQSGNSTGVTQSLLDYQPPATHGYSDSPSRAGDTLAESASAARKLEVRVSISDRLLTSVGPTDKVFIFARPATGQQIPLGVVQKQVSELPLTVMLDDSTAMMAGHNLSEYAGDLMVIARVSRSGDAVAAAGDLQGVIPHIKLDRTGFVDLVIDGQVD